jgi:hypothetical protein
MTTRRGRPRLPTTERMVPVRLCLLPEHVEKLRVLGNGNAAAAVRAWLDTILLDSNGQAVVKK